MTHHAPDFNALADVPFDGDLSVWCLRNPKEAAGALRTLRLAATPAQVVDREAVDRAIVMLKAAARLIMSERHAQEATIQHDETTCDGLCIAEECESAADALHPSTKSDGGHVLYKTGDADAPDVICDRNGEVALGLCRNCGRGEIELVEPCDNRLHKLHHSDPTTTPPAPSQLSGAEQMQELRDLRDWRNAVLSKCKTCDGWNELEWGGNKEGWGFVHYFIGHLNTRAIAALPLPSSPAVAPGLDRETLTRLLWNRFHNPDLWDHPMSVLARDECYECADDILQSPKAVAPSQQVREALGSLIIDNDDEGADDNCELCDGRGTVDAYTARTTDGRFEGRDEIGCPACAERNVSRTARNALAAQATGGGERERFEEWCKQSGEFTDWTRFGVGYARPRVELAWRAWEAAATPPAALPSAETLARLIAKRFFTPSEFVMGNEPMFNATDWSAAMSFARDIIALLSTDAEVK